MFIETVPNRQSPPAVLLRESYRDERGKAQKRTLANQRLDRSRTRTGSDEVETLPGDPSEGIGHEPAALPLEG